MSVKEWEPWLFQVQSHAPKCRLGNCEIRTFYRLDVLPITLSTVLQHRLLTLSSSMNELTINGKCSTVWKYSTSPVHMCAGVSEVVLSSCDALYEVPYSCPVLEDRGQLTVTNCRLSFVPCQSANIEPVSRAVSSSVLCCCSTLSLWQMGSREEFSALMNCHP